MVLRFKLQKKIATNRCLHGTIDPQQLEAFNAGVWLCITPWLELLVSEVFP
jgi:hypothetical protein